MGLSKNFGLGPGGGGALGVGGEFGGSEDAAEEQSSHRGG